MATFEIDKDHDIPVFSPVCIFCVNYISERKCKAFPDEIPMTIWLGENKHTKPYPGDNGIKFKKNPKR